MINTVYSPATSLVFAIKKVLYDPRKVFDPYNPYYYFSHIFIICNLIFVGPGACLCLFDSNS